MSAELPAYKGQVREAETVIQEHWNFQAGVTVIVDEGPGPTLLV